VVENSADIPELLSVPELTAILGLDKKVNKSTPENTRKETNTTGTETSSFLETEEDHIEENIKLLNNAKKTKDPTLLSLLEKAHPGLLNIALKDANPENLKVLLSFGSEVNSVNDEDEDQV